MVDTVCTYTGPLFAGLCVVALSSLAPLVLPVGTAALAVTQGLSLYGGLAVFGGFALYDTQKLLERGRLAEQGLVKADPVAESWVSQEYLNFAYKADMGYTTVKHSLRINFY